MVEHLLMANVDLVIAGAILLIALVVFALVHVHMLPVKTIPYVIGSLVALLGIEIFKAYRAGKLSAEIADQKKALEARRIQLEKMKKDLTISEQQYHEARSKLDEYEASYAKTIQLLKTEDATRRREIETMSMDEVMRTLGSGKPLPVSGGNP